MTQRTLLSSFAGVALAASVLGLGYGSAVAQDATADAAAAAKRLYTVKTCIACHGRDGKKAIGDYPDLAGQRADYMIAQVKDIMSGKRTGSPDASGNPRSKGMRGALIDPNGNNRITDAEIEQIAKWLSAQEARAPEPLQQPISEARMKDAIKLYGETCEACHGKTGSEPQEGFPAIAGQKRAYVLTQMMDIKKKARVNGQAEAMQGILEDMKDEQIELLADYVSQLVRAKP